MCIGVMTAGESCFQKAVVSVRPAFMLCVAETKAVRRLTHPIGHNHSAERKQKKKVLSLLQVFIALCHHCLSRVHYGNYM